MRNAVIRKKVLKEQAIIRSFMLAPMRWVPGFDVDTTFRTATIPNRLWAP